MSEPVGKFTILVVDDSEDIVALIDATLGKEYHVKTALDGRNALRLAFEKPRPDLIMLDVEMPGSNGYEVCRAIKASPALADVPVIFLTQRTEAQDVVQGFQLGAIDYLTKPINPPVLAARVRAHVELINRRNSQDEVIRVRTSQLEQTRLQLIRRLGRAMEYHETSAVGNRVVRLGHYARSLAEAAGAKPALCDLLMKAAPLHDIGKIGVPAQVLRKAGRLSAPEREQMQRHPEIGAEIIGEHDDPLLKLARTLALTHHERWDGAGYPAGAKGADIPWAGRVMAIVDSFESMTATQFHRDPMPFDLAADEIASGSGKQFDPQIVEAFRKALPAFRKVRESYSDALGDLLDLDFVAAAPAAAPATAPASPVAKPAAPSEVEEQSAEDANTMRATIEADEARSKALAVAQVRLKVERDLAAAAVKDYAAQKSAQKRAEDATARDAEAAALAKRRIAEETAAARAAQERAQAETVAAQAAQHAAQANAQALAAAKARAKSEEALAAAVAEKRKAEEAREQSAAQAAEAAARAAESAKKRAVDEAAAKRAIEERIRNEAGAAKSAQEAEAAHAQALADATSRAETEKAHASTAAAMAGAAEAARKRAADLEALEAGALQSAKQKAESEAAAKLAVEARLKAEAEAARLSRQAAETTARALADAEVRIKAERALTTVAAEKAAAEDAALAKATKLAALETDAAAQAKKRLEAEGIASGLEKRRLEQELLAKQAAQVRADAEAKTLAEAQARIKAEQARADAAAEKVKLEESARQKAAEVAAAEAKAVDLAKKRADTENQAIDAAKRRMAAEADAKQHAGERVELEAAGRQREREWAAIAPKAGAVETEAPVNRKSSRTPVYAAILVAVAVASAVFYVELQAPPQPTRVQAHSPVTPITAAPLKPIAAFAEGAPLELRMDTNVEGLNLRQGGK